MTLIDQKKSEVAKKHPSFWLLEQHIVNGQVLGEVGIFLDEAENVVDGKKLKDHWKEWLPEDVKAEILTKKGVVI